MNRIVFIGSKRLGLACLDAIQRTLPQSLAAAITFDDSADARSALERFSDYCRMENIPLHIAKNKGDTAEILRRYAPDFCFVSGWYWLFEKDTLDAVPNGFWGVHYSLLPKYRGSAPIVWSIINGEEEVGFSVFRLGEGMDDGDILWQERLPLTAEMNVRDAMDLLESRTVLCLHALLPQLQQKSLEAKPQHHQDATYCASRQPADGAIDWSRNAYSIHDFVRAQVPPYPGAFAFVADEKIFLTKTSVFPHPASGTSGRVLMLDKQSGTATVCCGNNTALVIHEIGWPAVSDVQPATRKIFSVSATLH